MPSEPSRPRPQRPRPTHAGRPAATGADRTADTTPGRRRLPVAAKSAIGAGVAIFAVASVASALPNSDSTPTPRTTAQAVHKPFDIVPSSSSLPSPAASPSAQPILRAKRQAPATKAVITGLAANGIPRVALNAYRIAAARMANAQPSCGIQWWLLAGIGREESDHGRFGGATLHPDGTSTPKIIGPALTGTGNEYIPAPPNGAALDGDSVYTHALGPMQFIPQTWDAYGVDANGDGKADIFNINDAALAAARYLCAAGGNLRTAAGQRAAILTYNHSTEYLNQVLALAYAYRTGVPVSGVPVGQVTGSLPPVAQSGPIPAANPGPPTAVRSGRYSAGHTSTRESPGAPSARTSSHAASGGSGSGGSGSGGSGSGGSASSPAAGGSTPAPVRTSAPVLLPLPTLTLLPHPSSSSTTTRPSPSPSKTCVLDVLGICI